MPNLQPLGWPPIAVELTASAAQLRAMLDRVRQNFEFMAQREPHWSVLSADRYLAKNIADTEDEFFRSGREPVAEFEAAAARCGTPPAPDGTCFELGCGLGRSTIWLADRFAHVTGADISRPHLRLAAATARRFGKRNLGFALIDDPRAIDTLPPFDAFFSLIVLQHNPPPVILAYLDAVLGRLKPGGLAYFQVPTYRHGYSFTIAEYLASGATLGMPEMHVVPQPALFGLFERSRCRLLEIREDGAAGDNHLSHRFFLEKRVAPA